MNLANSFGLAFDDDDDEDKSLFSKCCGYASSLMA